MASLFAGLTPTAQPKLSAVLYLLARSCADFVDGRHLDPTAERRRRKVDRNLTVQVSVFDLKEIMRLHLNLDEQVPRRAARAPRPPPGLRREPLRSLAGYEPDFVARFAHALAATGRARIASDRRPLHGRPGRLAETQRTALSGHLPAPAAVTTNRRRSTRCGPVARAGHTGG